MTRKLLNFLHHENKPTQWMHRCIFLNCDVSWCRYCGFQLGREIPELIAGGMRCTSKSIMDWKLPVVGTLHQQPEQGSGTSFHHQCSACKDFFELFTCCEQYVIWRVGAGCNVHHSLFSLEIVLYISMLQILLYNRVPNQNTFADQCLVSYMPVRKLQRSTILKQTLPAETWNNLHEQSQLPQIPSVFKTYFEEVKLGLPLPFRVYCNVWGDVPIRLWTCSTETADELTCELR